MGYFSEHDIERSCLRDANDTSYYDLIAENFDPDSHPNVIKEDDNRILVDG